VDEVVFTGPQLSARFAGQTLPLGATYFPVFSQAASLNLSWQAASGPPHLTTQLCALLPQLSPFAIASDANKERIEITARVILMQRLRLS
jgi:hypothetical protein